MITSKRKGIQVDQYDEIIWELNQGVFRVLNGKLLQYNRSFIKLFAYNESCLPLGIESYFSNEDDFKNLSRQALVEGNVRDRKVFLVRADKSAFLASITLMVSKDSNDRYFYDGTIMDVTDQVLPSKFNIERNQQMVLLISSYFLEPSNTRDFEFRIKKALENIGNHFEAVRAKIYYLEGNLFSLAFEWNAHSLSPSKCISISSYTLMELSGHQFPKKEIILDITSCIENLEVENYMRSHDISSAIIVPLAIGEEFVGFFSIEFKESKLKLLPQEVNSLKILGSLIANYIFKFRRESKLEMMTNKIISQNDRLRNYSYIVSHQIRAATCNLKALSDLIVNEVTTKDDREIVELLSKSVRKLDLSVNRANDVLNLDNQLFEKNEELEEYNLAPLVKEVISCNLFMIVSKNAVVVNKLPSVLKAKIFPKQFKEAISEVLNNALKYGVSINSRKIIIDCVKNSENIILKISDFGHGMNLKLNRSKLFKVGARFHKNSSDSLGMGLFLAKCFVKSMGGNIEIESGEGVGTLVMIKLNR